MERSLPLETRRRADWFARASQATSFPDVNALLLRLLTDITGVLGERFLAMYLHGSLAGGEFDPQRSDIDFVVVTEGPLPTGALAALREMHCRIAASDLKWARNFEGSYIPRQAIRRHDPDNCVFPAVRCDGSFDLDRHGSEWVIQRHIIREHGVILAGPDPKGLIDPVTADELRQAERELLESWWASRLEDPSYMRASEYQAYAVLTMCRALYTLEHGTIATKPAAAAWAKAAVGSRWSGLIDRATSWRHGIELDMLDEVVGFIRYTIERSRTDGRQDNAH